jgi:hypothetical protein
VVHRGRSWWCSEQFQNHSTTRLQSDGCPLS